MFMVLCNVGKIDPFDVDALMGGDSEDFNFGELKKGSHVAFLISPQLPIEELGAVMPVRTWLGGRRLGGKDGTLV